jgi:diguanylate cyclase
MLARETNRRLGEPRPIPAGTTDLLRTVAEREGGRLHVITGRDDIGCRKNLSRWSRYRSPIALPLCCGWRWANRLLYRMRMSGALDELVTAAAAELMAATAGNFASISQRVVRDLVSHFGVDVGFLRHNDHTIHATVLVALWPPRENVPDPDPLGVIYFADADSVIARAENLKVPEVFRPEPANADHQRFIEEATGFPVTSLAYVPLLSGDVTTGTLGFVKFGDREWLPEELNALQAVATLFAQLQARIVAEEQIHYLAEHDDLTGLLNRRTLIAYLEERLVDGQPGPVSVLHLDVDRLKVINDHLGQNAADRFIKAFAELLREAADVPSVIARFGGDEFVVVPTPPTDVEGAEVFAQCLQNRVRQQVVIDGEKLSRTVSIGVAVGIPGSDSTSALLRRADQAALSAKSSGGRKVARFSPEMSEKYAIRNDIELELQGTIDSGSSAMVLHYLPEFDMRTGEVLGAEALVRWQHPTRGLLMPESFIGVAESINLVGRLGRLVMRSAFEQFKLWRSRGVGRDAVLSVNVSPIQLVAEGIVDAVAATLDAFSLDAGAVCLEITESVVVQDIDATRKTLAGLKDIGVQIAIDDFGTGYSALTYLKSLPVDMLKIDATFVRELGTNAGDLAIVRSIMSLAKAFGLDVVAEGVETAAAARALLELGCYRAQGFLLSRPLDSEAMETLLAKRSVPMDFSNVGVSAPDDLSASNNRGTGKSSLRTSNHIGMQPLQ